MLGDARTAEELGRALPGVRVLQSSSGERVLAEVRASRPVVVATPGAEPVADGGYAAVVLLDTWLLLGRADLRAAEEALRRWADAAALVRRPGDGGRVLAVGDAAEPALQALVRWDPGGLARREIDERISAHLPPSSRVATVQGCPTTSRRPWPACVAGRRRGARTGPGGGARRPRDRRGALRRAGPACGGSGAVEALLGLQVHRSTRKLPHLRVEVDPAALG